VNRRILIDTGCWIAYYEPNQKAHSWAIEQTPLFESQHILMPWPLVYETLRTKFVKHPNRVVQWELLLKRLRVEFLNDDHLVDEVYRQTLLFASRGTRRISMVDALCRFVLADPATRIQTLFTTNPKDFHDVCKSRNIDMVTPRS